MVRVNKLLKFTPATKSVASAGQPTLRFGCPLARRSQSALSIRRIEESTMKASQVINQNGIQINTRRSRTFGLSGSGIKRHLIYSSPKRFPPENTPLERNINPFGLSLATLTPDQNNLYTAQPER